MKKLDLEKVRVSLEKSLEIGPLDFSMLMGGEESSEEDKKNHKMELRNSLRKLQALAIESKKVPVYFKSVTDIPSWLGETYSLNRGDKVRHFFYRERLYEAIGPNSEEEFRLLVFREFDREQKIFDDLKSKYVEKAKVSEKSNRKSISEKVRRSVWRRDEGCCVVCGSRDRLEYDHIIPVAKGGGNTARNIELLCEVCNRAKSDKIQ